MRSLTNPKSLVAVYGLGLIWTVAVVVGALVLSGPMLALYGSLGIDFVGLQFMATLALVLSLATAVTFALGLALRGVAEHA